jgi:hypothetical protein
VEVANGSVRLRLYGTGSSIEPALLWTLPGDIEHAIFEAAPDAERVTIEGLDFLSLAPARRAAE